MNRYLIINELIKNKSLNSYLEIGVFNGKIFFRVKSSFKIAVDPFFRLDRLRRLGKCFVNSYNLFNRFFEKKSDDFFLQDAPKVFANRRCDLALIDGMHEYKFALRDVENTLNYLADDGVIIMHDCNPPTKEAACSFEEWKTRGSNDSWNGDVWKTIVHLRSLHKDINVFVLDCDNGLGIITKGNPESSLSFTQENIEQLTFEDFDKNKSTWLNLKSPNYFKEYFKLNQ